MIVEVAIFKISLKFWDSLLDYDFVLKDFDLNIILDDWIDYVSIIDLLDYLMFVSLKCFWGIGKLVFNFLNLPLFSLISLTSLS